jgi:protein-S-isoprenylcysteine O-methyltransferase Ste14
LGGTSGSRALLSGDSAVFVLVRVVTYSTLFIGLVLILLPAQLLSQAGIGPPESFGALQIAGALLTIGGGVLALSCIFAFAVVGKGTPAPFDPPRRLVARGPYAAVRNPMYIGAGLALVGASLFYESLALLAYAAAFFLFTHVFVVLYEEPTLRRTFGTAYEAYCGQVRRWWPRVRRGGHAGAA